MVRALTVTSLVMLAVSSQAIAGNCGAVSTFFDGPETRDIYEARIGAIDSSNTLLENREHRLAPGKHELRIYEFIDAPELKVPARHRGYGKVLTVEVEANKVYRVGAKFNAKKPFDRNEFWEPVIWQVSDKNCEP
ncbi:hypothetical protein HPT27_08755 [Permianibacter sp. IMCC34836]|uniref:hypothetical protein n=1 Tax=Permianibacter fluminis TaxID=2738515 RepID=UPI00155514ED|nr:hypothetical protein [Permianibacter fluminis]NQD37113.1 hypothetical protein [Permianibacter fluminis]